MCKLSTMWKGAVMPIPTRELTYEEKNELNRIGVLALAESLHEHCNGASDWMEPEELIQACSWITYKLTRWDPAKGIRTSVTYDNAVKELCMAVLGEVERWLGENENYLTYNKCPKNYPITCSLPKDDTYAELQKLMKTTCDDCMGAFNAVRAEVYTKIATLFPYKNLLNRIYHNGEDIALQLRGGKSVILGTIRCSTEGTEYKVVGSYNKDNIDKYFLYYMEPVDDKENV